MVTVTETAAVTEAEAEAAAAAAVEEAAAEAAAMVTAAEAVAVPLQTLGLDTLRVGVVCTSSRLFHCSSMPVRCMDRG